jgi:curved DNA-binding protein CbpA
LLLVFLAAIISASAVRSTKYYDVLGISPDADDRTIKKGYKKMAL